jgi:uncharacterized protein (DUF1697 family)
MVSRRGRDLRRPQQGIGGGDPQEILSQIPFDLEIVVCPGKQILELIASEPFAGRLRRTSAGGSRRSGKPKSSSALPASARRERIVRRVYRVDAGFALGIWRRSPKGSVYPSDFLEKTLGVSATTRGWETLLRIAKILEA